jgi:V/A-type H+-transporting ATPase subunit C
MSDLLFVTLILAGIASIFVLVIVRARRMMPYIYCSAKVSAWEARLLPEVRLLEFADSAKVANILAGLDDTDYRPHLSDIPRVEDVDVVAVERALKNNLTERYQELLKYVPEERKETVERLIQRTDIWNLKTLLTAIHNKVPKGKRMEEMVPSPTFSEERLKLLTSAEDFQELLDYLKETEYFSVLSEALEGYERLGLVVLLSALDKHYYSSLWADVLSKKAQRRTLKALVGYELDAVNIKLILRLKREGAPPDEITRYVILPPYELTEEMMRSMIIADGIPSAIEVIRHTIYGQILRKTLSEVEATGSLFPIEKALDEGLLGSCKGEAIVRPMDMGPVLAHIYLKEKEVRNLRAIIKLKTDRVEPGKIKETLVRVPKIEL